MRGGRHAAESNTTSNFIIFKRDLYFHKNGTKKKMYRKPVICFVSFVAGSQLVHSYFNPLADLDAVTEEKKRKLREAYYEKLAEKTPSSVSVPPNSEDLKDRL